MNAPEDPVLWKQIVMALLAAYGAVITWLWKHAAKAIQAKADKDELQGIIRRFDDKLKEDREERQLMFAKIDNVACAFHKHAEMVIRELGERPRREEIQRNGGGQ